MFEKIQDKNISKAIVTQIQALTMNGSLKAGDQLPSERDLAQAMATSQEIETLYLCHQAAIDADTDDGKAHADKLFHYRSKPAHRRTA